MSATAKLFKNGQSQAVRLPKSYRMSGSLVKIRHFGKGVLIEPMGKNFDSLFESLELFSEDFMQDGRNQLPQQEREKLF